MKIPYSTIIARSTSIVLLISVSFLLVVGKSFANQTAYQYAGTTCASNGTSLLNMPNTTGIPDSVYGTLNGSGSDNCTESNYLSFSLPTNSTVTSIDVNFYNGSPTSGQETIVVADTSSNTALCTFAASPLFMNSGQNIITETFAHCASLTPAFLNSNNLGINTHSFSGSPFQTRDTVGVRVNWNPPVASLAVSSLVASPSAQKITFNIAGDTTYTAVGEKCKISLNELDISTPSSPSLVTSNFATILLDAATPRTSTLYQGNNTYLGYNFSSSSSAWNADNITAPFFSTKNIEIVGYTSCYHQTINSDGSLSIPSYDLKMQGLDSSPNVAIQFDPSLIATPSALQNTPSVYQGNCNSVDVICSFEQWLYTFFCTAFCPNLSVDNEDFTALKTNLNNKVPFAYVNAVVNNLDFTNTASSTAVPDLNIQIATIAAIPGIHMASITQSTYTMHDDGRIATFLATLRPYETIVLGLGVVFFFMGIIWTIF